MIARSLRFLAAVLTALVFATLLHLVAAVADGLLGNGAAIPAPATATYRVCIVLGLIHADLLLPLASEAAVPKTVMIDVSGPAPLVRACPREYLKAHRTASSLRSKKGGLASNGAA